MSEPILQLHGITVTFDGFTVLDALELSVDRGELRFLIGPNGAGKTTLLDVVTGRTRPQAGRAIFDGAFDVLTRAEDELVRLGIGRKFQTPAVYGSLSVAENVEVAIGAHGGAAARWARLLRRRTSEETDRIAAVLTTVGLHHRREARAATLSHGEKQWLEIAMLLVQEHRLLLLDEPVAGMTRSERDRTGDLIEAIAESETRAGRSVVVVEHDMGFVRRHARTVTVLHEGRILMEGSMEQVQSDARVVEVYLGRSGKAA